MASCWYQSCCGPSAWLSSAWSVLGHHSEHGGTGPTAPDGVAGDSACQDLGLRVGGLTGRNAGLGRADQGSSTCYLLGFCLGAVKTHLSHSWSPDWTAKRRFKGLWGGGDQLQRRGQWLAHHLYHALSLHISVMRIEMTASTLCSRSFIKWLAWSQRSERFRQDVSQDAVFQRQRLRANVAFLLLEASICDGCRGFFWQHGVQSIFSVASTSQNLCKMKCKGHVCSIINSVILILQRRNLKTQDEEDLNGVKVRT